MMYMYCSMPFFIGKESESGLRLNVVDNAICCRVRSGTGEEAEAEGAEEEMQVAPEEHEEEDEMQSAAEEVQEAEAEEMVKDDEEE
jgi:hypothetical protein